MSGGDRGARDIAVIGGGIIGTAAAMLLARAGRRVSLFEREAVAAGASGRNSGVLQHPYDRVLASLHRRTLELYRDVAGEEPELRLSDRPIGILLVGPDGEAMREATGMLGAEHPELLPTYLAANELRHEEPTLAPGVGACRLETGYPVVPWAATQAYARRAVAAGVQLRVGHEAEPMIEGGRAAGVVLADGRREAFGQVLIAAGPWSSALIPGWREQPPIRPTYGVVVATRLADPPRHVLEELGIDPGGSEVASSFSLVTAGGQSSVGSTFLEERPEPLELRDTLLERGARYVPALRRAQVLTVRACARPVSFDRLPLVGSVADIEGLFVCAGHGPWGMSTGPASAELVAQLMLGRPVELPAELRAERWPQPAGLGGTGAWAPR
jgi:D-hydroxyproline dehydrogenase subunit beta